MLNLLGEGAIGVMKYTGDPLVDAANVIQRNSSINEGTHATSTVPPLQEYGKRPPVKFNTREGREVVKILYPAEYE